MKTQGYDYKNIMKFEKGMINGLTKKLSSLRFGNYDALRDQGNTRIIEAAKNFGLEIDYNDSNLPGEKFIFMKIRKITPEQTKFGKTWLKNHFFKKNGEAREGKATKYVSEQTLKIAKSVIRFEFIGVLGVANNFEICNFLPIYRAYNRKGEYFDYCPIHWGQPIIMEASL